MSEWADLLRFLHVVGATALLGTGAGIAFFMAMAHRTGDARIVAHVARTVVIADALFTASAVVIQPATGVALAFAVGHPLTSGWIVVSLVLYVLVGLFWLPVVWMQIKMRALAEAAAARSEPLPAAYHRLYRVWFAFGFPAFAAVLVILWLMLTRPAIPGFPW
jgi:uncharacterized membrane protein